VALPDANVRRNRRVNNHKNFSIRPISIIQPIPEGFVKCAPSTSSAIQTTFSTFENTILAIVVFEQTEDQHGTYSSLEKSKLCFHKTLTPMWQDFYAQNVLTIIFFLLRQVCTAITTRTGCGCSRFQKCFHILGTAYCVGRKFISIFFNSNFLKSTHFTTLLSWDKTLI